MKIAAKKNCLYVIMKDKYVITYFKGRCKEGIYAKK